MDMSPSTVAALTSTSLPELDHLWTEVARLQSPVQHLIMDRLSRQSSREHLEFLEHHVDHVDSPGKPLKSKVQVIHHFPKPTTQSKQREFLGLVNFCHPFLPNCAAILVPCNSMLCSTQHSQAPLKRSPAAESDFTPIKDVLMHHS